MRSARDSIEPAEQVQHRIGQDAEHPPDRWDSGDLPIPHRRDQGEDGRQRSEQDHRDHRDAQGIGQLRPDQAAHQFLTDRSLLVDLGATADWSWPRAAIGQHHPGPARPDVVPSGMGRGHRPGRRPENSTVLELAQVPSTDREIGGRPAAGNPYPVPGVGGSQFDDAVQRDQVAAVHPDKSGRTPLLLQHGEGSAQQVRAAAVHVQPGIVTLGLGPPHVAALNEGRGAREFDGDHPVAGFPRGCRVRGAAGSAPRTGDRRFARGGPRSPA